MGKRRLAREYCLQALYLADIGNLNTDEISKALYFQREKLRDHASFAFASRLVSGTLANLPFIDSVIQEHAKNWKISRMSATDRCILRMAVYEIIFTVPTPILVIIDEAIELGKKYSTENSGAFINGVLDRIKEIRNNLPFQSETQNES